MHSDYNIDGKEIQTIKEGVGCLAILTNRLATNYSFIGDTGYICLKIQINIRFFCSTLWIFRGYLVLFNQWFLKILAFHTI